MIRREQALAITAVIAALSLTAACGGKDGEKKEEGKGAAPPPSTPRPPAW